jgi:hypothetical protein
MSSSPESQTRTRMFARVLGPFLVIVDVTAVVRTSDMKGLLSEFAASSVWSWVAGSFILLAGLIVVALHPYWRGAAAIIVSIVGWLVVLRGLFLLAFPGTFVSLANKMIEPPVWWQIVCIAFAAVGLYLTYYGWIPTRARPTPQTVSASPNVPRAA